MLVDWDGDGVVRSTSLYAMFESAAFVSQLNQILAFALWRYRQRYAGPYMDTRFVLNAKYTYEEECLLLGWGKNINAQNAGGYVTVADTGRPAVEIAYRLLTPVAPDLYDYITGSIN